MAVLKGKEIRRTIHDDEWWFSIVVVCGVLAGSVGAGTYWRKLKQRLKADGSEVVTKCHGLKLVATDGKKYTTDCANTEGIFRIIQPTPSPKAEPFKRWWAKVGKLLVFTVAQAAQRIEISLFKISSFKLISR